MSSINVSDLAYAHPAGDLLFSEVSFRVPGGTCAGLVGANGVGKSTLLRILAGELAADTGTVAIDGQALYMPQDIGAEDGSVRELLLHGPGPPEDGGDADDRRRARARRGDEAAGVRLGRRSASGRPSAATSWRAAGTRSAAACSAARSTTPGTGPRNTMSGGERKRLALELLFASEAPALLLDEPDNFLDIPGKRWLESTIKGSRKTVLVISHDRELLSAACDSIVTLEGDGAWVHGGSYRGYPEAREHRQQLMADRVTRWKRRSAACST